MYSSQTTNYPKIRTNYSVSLMSEKEGKDLSADLKVAVKHSDLATEIQLGSPAYYALEEVQNNLKEQVILVLVLIMLSYQT
jgi:hypothetical protein